MRNFSIAHFSMSRVNSMSNNHSNGRGQNQFRANQPAWIRLGRRRHGFLAPWGGRLWGWSEVHAEEKFVGLMPFVSLCGLEKRGYAFEKRVDVTRLWLDQGELVKRSAQEFLRGRN